MAELTDGGKPRVGLVLMVPVALVGLGTMAALTFALIGLVAGPRPVGDGRDPASYGFDLTGLTPEDGVLSGSGNPRDFLQPLAVDATMRGDAMVGWNQTQRTKYVVTADRVIGLELNGESRAWPLSVMNVHEVIHDTLGGVPIAVTYSPLCDAAVVFDRRVEGRIIEFGISGLLLDGNLLLYDRDSSTPSLWSQLAFRAVSGPLVGRTLTPLPGVHLVAWSEWLAEHPSTTVPTPDDAMRKRIKATSYERYWLAGKPMYPLRAPTPSGPGFPSLMERVVATRRDDGSWLVTPPGRAGGGLEVPCLWFAWAAFHGSHSSTEGFHDGPDPSQ